MHCWHEHPRSYIVSGQHVEEIAEVSKKQREGKATQQAHHLMSCTLGAKCKNITFIPNSMLCPSICSRQEAACQTASSHTFSATRVVELVVRVCAHLVDLGPLQGSNQLLFLSIFLQEALQFFPPVSTSSSCEFQPSLPICFFRCTLSSLLPPLPDLECFRCPRKICFCLGHLSLALASLFDPLVDSLVSSFFHILSLLVSCIF